MRVVIDLQSAQGTNRKESIGQNSIAFAQAIARSATDNEIWLVLNDAFPNAVETIRVAFEAFVPSERVRVFPGPPQALDRSSNREWTIKASERIREAFIADLRPDLVFVLNMFEGLVDGVVASIGQFEHSAPVVAFLHDLLPIEAGLLDTGDAAFRNWFLRQVMSLRAADKILTSSALVSATAIQHFQLDAEQVTSVSADQIKFYRRHEDDGDEATARWRFELPTRFVLADSRTLGAGGLSEIRRAFNELPVDVTNGIALVTIGEGREIQLHGSAPGSYRAAATATDADIRAMHGIALVSVMGTVGQPLHAEVIGALRSGAPVLLLKDAPAPLDPSIFNVTLPSDAEGLVFALTTLLSDAVQRNRLSMLGLRYAQSLIWEEAARVAWQVFNQLHARASASKDTLVRTLPVRPRLAYFSPLPPAKSGIADYSAALLPELASYYEIDVITDEPGTSSEAVSACFAIRDVKWFYAHAFEYARILYHFGNSPFHHYMLEAFERHPGTVVLHDFYLGHLLAHPLGFTPAYLAQLYESHGYRAVVDAADPEKALWRYPINLRLLSHARGILVHSEHAIEQGRLWYGSGIERNMRKVDFLRAPALVDRQLARSRLGIGNDEFVVCSFGQLGAAKLNHRLLEAWVKSRLTRAQRCKLVFVGGSPGQYGQDTIDSIVEHAEEYEVVVTGFASPELYKDYLDAADTAVQLRANSRGETSAAVFDCLAHNAPLIVNAHGSMQELPAGACVSIQDNFEIGELTAAIERLWLDVESRRDLAARGSQYLRQHHASRAVAKSYVDAIEFFALESSSARRARLLDSVMNIRVDGPVSQDDHVRVARAIDEASPDIAVRTLFVDVSAVVRVDLKTGIQRVTRALLLNLLTDPPLGWRVEPVYLSDGPDRQFHYARVYTQAMLGIELSGLEDEPVRPLPGDILLGLDLFWFVSDIEAAYRRWHALGVSIQFVIYDILPLLQRENFPEHLFDVFESWLNFVIRASDGLLCISEAVAGDVRRWVDEHPVPRQRPLEIKAFPLGADLQTTAPSRGFPIDADETLNSLSARVSVLMVGTVEPRKRYMQALDAFEVLWSRGVDVNLVIVGKQGWLKPENAVRLTNHVEKQRRFYWLQDASDEYLDEIYKASRVLLAASSGEGFGLPLIEAAMHGVPIIARDLPVFREVAGDEAFYFTGDSGEDLAAAIEQWIRQFGSTNERVAKSAITVPTWKDSATALATRLFEIRSTVNRTIG